MTDGQMNVAISKALGLEKVENAFYMRTKHGNRVRMHDFLSADGQNLLLNRAKEKLAYVQLNTRTRGFETTWSCGIYMNNQGYHGESPSLPRAVALAFHAAFCQGKQEDE